MTSPSNPAQRIAWLDVAKALAIVLVVVYHVSGWFFGFVFEGATHRLAQVWRELSILLIPIRIPLFFLVSGVLAHRAVHRSWRELARTRLSDLLWPYAVWSILIAPLWFVRIDRTGGDPWEPVLSGLGYGGAHLWFLTALAVFLIVGKLVRHFPLIAIVTAFACAFVVRPMVMPWLHAHLPAALADNVGRWMIFLCWFLLGCFGRRLVLYVAAHSIPFAVAGTGVVVGVALTGTTIPGSYRVPILAVAGLAGFVAWSSVMSRSAIIRRLCGYLAPRTLAIYVGHAFLLEVIALGLLVARRVAPGVSLSSDPMMIAFVPVVTCGLVWITTWIYDRCVPGRLAWIYQPPWRSARSVAV